MSTLRRSPNGEFVEVKPDGRSVPAGKKQGWEQEEIDKVRKVGQRTNIESQDSQSPGSMTSENAVIPLYEWENSIFDLGCAEGRWADREPAEVRKYLEDRLIAANAAISAALSDVHRRKSLHSMSISKVGNVYGTTGNIVDAIFALIEVSAALNIPLGDKLMALFDDRATRLEQGTQNK